jgi:hypothetical protein
MDIAMIALFALLAISQGKMMEIVLSVAESGSAAISLGRVGSRFRSRVQHG